MTANEPDYDKILEMCVTPEKAPDEATYVTLEFKKGIPVSLNGEAMEGIALIEKLNVIAGANGVGIIDIVENRLVGMKSRGVYETPAGTVLYHAHDKLEQLYLDKDTFQYKQLLANKYAELVYNGLWYTPLRKALAAFVDETQQNVEGFVKMKLYKGNITDAGVVSAKSLYSESFATFESDDVYNHTDAAGFIRLFGLPTSIRVMKEQAEDQATHEELEDLLK